MYCLLLPPGNARVFVEQLFGLFDSDKSGSIDFKVLKDSQQLFKTFKFVFLGVHGGNRHAYLRDTRAETTLDI